MNVKNLNDYLATPVDAVIAAMDASRRIPAIDPLQREVELKILRSKERQLTAQLQDCHDRIEQLTERPKVDADYIASIVDCQGGDVELLTAAHKSGHLHLTGRRWFDAPVMAEFQRCYEQHNKMVGAV